MLGQRSLFSNIFSEQNDTVTIGLADRKSGRSEVLDAKKNELIVCRYYYYARLHGKNYNNAIGAVADEIFLAQRTVVNILTDNSSLLHNLNNTDPDLKYFRNKYPYWVWKEKSI